MYSPLCTLTEVFPCFFPSCKANSRVKLTKTGHGLHSSKLVVICVLYIVGVKMCTVILPLGVNPTALNKYIIYHTHTYIYTHIHTHIHTYIHSYIHMYVHTYIHTYVINTYANAYVHTYMHTYICTLRQSKIHRPDISYIPLRQ